MFIKIYFNEIPVLLSDASENYAFSINEKANELVLENPDAEQIRMFIKIIESTHTSGTLISEDLEGLKEKFFSNFTTIHAGGGLVFNKQNELLMIFRRGKWDLPKGKLDEGETIENCALREVEEETGLEQVELGEKVGDTFHVYIEKGHHIVKHSHWYKMKYLGSDKPVPQTEEQITEIKWVSKEGSTQLLSNSYPLINDLLTDIWKA